LTVFCFSAFTSFVIYFTSDQNVELLTIFGQEFIIHEQLTTDNSGN